MGAYEADYFRRTPPVTDDQFCKNCRALRSSHADTTCPVKGGGTYAAGGRFLFRRWNSTTDEFSDDVEAMRQATLDTQLNKLLDAQRGTRMVWVADDTPGMNLTYQECRMLLRLLGNAYKADDTTTDPALFGGLTPDEVGNLVAKLIDVPLD